MPLNLFERLQAAWPQHLRMAHVVYCGAIFNFLSGLLALACWAEGWPRLIRSQAAIMHADVAIFCVAAGVGLLTAMRQNYTATRIIGILLALIANMHLTAGYAGFSISVPKLFPNATARILSPVQAAGVEMTPTTAVVFFLFGCALALVSRRRRSNQILAVKAAIGVIISTIGLIVLCAYLTGGVFGPFAGAISQMAPLTALCTLVLGIAVCALCSIHARFMFEELSPSSVAIATIGLVLILGAMDLAIIVKTRAALLFTSDIEAAARQVLLENLISIVLASYGVAILLTAVIVGLTRFEARHHAGGFMKAATKAQALPGLRETTRKIPGHLHVQTIETAFRTPKRPPQLNLKKFVSGR
jgi:hypothetical protein